MPDCVRVFYFVTDIGFMRLPWSDWFPSSISFIEEYDKIIDKMLQCRCFMYGWKRWFRFLSIIPIGHSFSENTWRLKSDWKLSAVLSEHLLPRGICCDLLYCVLTCQCWPSMFSQSVLKELGHFVYSFCTTDQKSVIQFCFFVKQTVQRRYFLYLMSNQVRLY